MKEEEEEFFLVGLLQGIPLDDEEKEVPRRASKARCSLKSNYG